MVWTARADAGHLGATFSIVTMNRQALGGRHFSYRALALGKERNELWTMSLLQDDRVFDAGPRWAGHWPHIPPRRLTTVPQACIVHVIRLDSDRQPMPAGLGKIGDAAADFVELFGIWRMASWRIAR
jgi:hypothetical protein